MTSPPGIVRSRSVYATTCNSPRSLYSLLSPSQMLIYSSGLALSKVLWERYVNIERCAHAILTRHTTRFTPT